MRFSESYLDVSVSFVVPDHRRKEFATMDSIRAIENLSIAVKRDDYLQSRVQANLPKADALLLDAESGSAWTFLYPGFRPVVPRDLRVKLPLGFAVVRQDREFAEFLSQWLELKKNSGELQELYDYWILGRIESEHEPRWSILRNVLGVGME